MARDRDFERGYRAEVATPLGVQDHYVRASSAEEAAEFTENDDRWRDCRPIAVLRVYHQGAVAWVPPTPLTPPPGGEQNGAPPRARAAAGGPDDHDQAEA